MIYPKAKRWGHQTIEAGRWIAYCAGFNRGRYGFAHECSIYGPDGVSAKGLARWCNHTWENFTYETSIRDAIEKLPAEYQQEACEALIDKKIRDEKESCDKFLKMFESAYKNTSDETKERLKNVTIHNESEAHAVYGWMVLDGLMNEKKESKNEN